MPIVVGPQFQKFHFLLLLFSLGEGPPKMLTSTLKLSHTKFVQKYLFLACLRAKNDSLLQIKNSFAEFWKKNKNLISNFNFGDSSLMYMFSANFLKNINYYGKVPVII